MRYDSVHGKGDINKQVGIMGGGTVAKDMYENGHKIGIMGGDDSVPHKTAAPPAVQVKFYDGLSRLVSFRFIQQFQELLLRLT